MKKDSTQEREKVIQINDANFLCGVGSTSHYSPLAARDDRLSREGRVVASSQE